MKNSNIFVIDENGTLLGMKDSLSIPEGVTSLGNDIQTRNSTLLSYDYLTNIDIPSTVTEISTEFYLFLDVCKSVEQYNLHPDNKNYVSEDGVIYTADKKTLVKFPPRKSTDCFIIDVEEISNNAFCDAKMLSTLIIRPGCKKIGESAFMNTIVYSSLEEGEKGLRKYYIPPSVKEIKGEIFEHDYCEDGCYYPEVVVGGEVGSTIWEHANSRGLKFIVVKEDEIDDFIATPIDELKRRIEEEIENEEYSFEFSEEGFAGRFAGGTLELFATDNKNDNVTVCKLSRKLSEGRRENVKKLILGDGINAIAPNAFAEYYKLESIFFGPDISFIDASAFYWDYRIKELSVDDRNEHYKAIDGVIFSSDLKTLVLYPSGREEFYYEIPAHVEIVGECSMMNSSLKCIKFGSNVKEIKSMACYNTFGQHHFYVDPSVTSFEDEFIFGVDGKLRMCVCMYTLVVGGKKGSAIEEYCKTTGRNGIKFEVVDDDKLDEWLTPPPPESKGYSEDELPF